MNAFLNKIYTLDLVSIHLSYTLKKGLTVPLRITPKEHKTPNTLGAGGNSVTISLLWENP